MTQSRWIVELFLLMTCTSLLGLAQSLPDLGLIIVDPITNYLGPSKMTAEEQMRALLTPLAALAAELGMMVITVGHFNRCERGTDPLHRLMGAAAFGGVARAVYTFGPDPDSDSKFRHVMTVARACGGEGSALRYRTELVEENCPQTASRPKSSGLCGPENQKQLPRIVLTQPCLKIRPKKTRQR